ncbi:keratin, type I cytoskeletal 14-like [Bufo bufo]|uniref:keratin, type I cytoskeletal 14-like n=1 Tax=Bufo bufo TaxID=8384 RepID=UPI001ABE83E8|nr:keratin, type I cytoskeletal 14-like [Bufo bufo]
MQNLNSRLSVYMDEVKALEDSNLELENKIRHWYETHKPKKVDNSKHYKTIEDLKNKIMHATMDKNELTVKVDNARMAADDFRVKYESELHMHHSVQSDIEGLRKVLDELTLERSSLESQVEILREEMACTKKNHEQEIKSLQGQTGDVSVQLDAAPGINILKVLNDMRAEYEELAEENRRKAEQDFNQKIFELSNEISCSSAEIETGKSEVTEMRRYMQTMEIDLQSQHAMKSSLENTLAETQCRYASQLAQIQQMVSNFEEQLAQVRNDMENQSCEYNILLDIKTRLENEIDMYCRLLEKGSYSSSGLGSGSSSRSGSGSSRDEWSSRQNERYDSSSMTDPQKKKIVTKITEERQDGRLVSTKIDKI